MNEAERRAASEKYYQKLRAELDERIRGDKQLRKIAEKIANKTADFNDTAKYSEIVSNYIGAVLQENVGEITSPVAKEFVCKELLRDQHSTINELFESVQVSIDEQNGIHIKTQKPKFPEERVDKVAHALEDPTVPLKTIKRRANAPVANVSKSFHDDCVKKNAQFRHDAGLKCYIVRIGTKCCEWCSEVAGKYEFGDQPDGIFRRHDNCDCTIIYDGQVLRGKQNADGSRSKTWEELPNANAADYTPPSLSEEQGRAIEQRNLAQIRGLKINNSSIDNSSGNGIIDLTGEGLHRKVNPDKIEPMPKKQLRKIVKSFKKQGGVIQMDSETDYYLTKRNVEGITYNSKTILLKQKTGRAAVFEELIHTAQYRDGKMDGSTLSRINCEIEAQKKLLKNAKAYKLTNKEIEQTQFALKGYEKELDEYYRNGGA